MILVPVPTRRLLAAVAGVIALVLSACSAPAPMLQPTGTTQTPSAAGVEEFYDQRAEWTSCGRDFECAAVEVPIDYTDPEGGSIEIQLKKYALPGAEGMVLINPGGPGGSGIETVELAAHVFTSTLRSHVAIVGFDPRGVGTSAPISCYDDEQLDEWYSTEYDVETDSGWQAYLESVTDYGQACLENNPDTLGFVDTVSAARDMDVIRAALGMDKLDYLGFSYGTKLGATYADLFGPNVGRFVLDGAMDLSLDGEALTLGQLRGFERAYRVYLEDCMAGPDCPFTGSVDDAYDDTVAMLEELAVRPVESGDPDRPVTDGDLLNAIVLSLYSTENWGLLSSAISAMLAGDGGQVKFLADFAIERDEDGHYKPSDGAMFAINCLDLPGHLDKDATRAQAEEFVELSPLFGASMAYGSVGCAGFPIESGGGPRLIAAPEAPPMVVVGTTGDPATPYEWSTAMAEQLEHSVLLTWEGEGHTAYGKGSCIDDAVDEFFIDGILPEDGLRC